MIPAIHHSNNPHLRWFLVAVLLCLAAGLLFWLNYSVANFGGIWEISDFMFHWLGGRAALDGVDFYDPQAWEALHVRYAGVYRDNPIFLYWLPVAYLFAPFALLPVRISAALWLLCSEAMLIFAIARFWNDLPLPRVPGLRLLVVFLFVLFEPVLVILWTGQYSMLMLFLAVLLYGCLRRGRDAWTGLCLMLLCLRPNPAVLLIPLVLLWLLWQKRWRALAWFGASSAVVALASELASPGWFVRWLGFTLGSGGKLSYYINYTPTLWGMVYDALGQAPAAVRLITTLALCAGLLAASFFVLRRANQLNFGAVLSTAITLSLLLTLYAWNYDQVLLLLPMLWSLSKLKSAPPKARAWVWPLAAFILLVLPYSLRLLALQRQRDPYSALVSLAVLIFTLWAAWQSRPAESVLPGTGETARL